MRLSPILAILATAAPISGAWGGTLKVGETVILDRAGATYDYRGATLVWTGRGDCSQKEGMPPMFTITAPDVTLKNAVVVGAPDGIHICSARVTLENLTFPKVCEDAVTFKRGARRATVRDCQFAGAEDKVIQAGHGRGHRVYRCRFEGCRRPFRSKTGVTALFYRNVVVNCHSAVRADGRGSRTLMWGNRMEGVRHRKQTYDGARVVRFITRRR